MSIRPSRCFLRDFYLKRPLLEATMPLQNLDLVSVRILDEEEPREQLAVAVELDNVARRKSRGGEPRVFALDVVDRDGHMSVAVANLIGRVATLIDGELALDRRLVIRQVHEREIGKVEPFRDL